MGTESGPPATFQADHAVYHGGEDDSIMEPWMIKTAGVIFVCYFLNGALYAVHVWLRRRNSASPRQLIRHPGGRDHAVIHSQHGVQLQSFQDTGV
jgi:hypothetical protein